ncbi:hypothetical protein BJP40_27830 [Streptomyces sp. CC53]|uniref:hypothetical protein n=1 Tax=unclassified Streptomyces TaxID=2593676 RepID=UPI0008DD895B|nr:MULTISPECIES: hypothetical protein [unclassified Streptomyces]OII62612.1 hypothetical protein BJP40_27830 [Streptomyces sp. CC53]
MSAGRWVLGAAGVTLMGVGAWLLADTRTPWDVVVWLAGAVVLHDAVVAPLVLGLGLLVARTGTARGVVRGALVVAGGLTLVALPVLLAPRRPSNPSVLPLDYTRNWALLMAAVAVGALLVAGAPAVGRRLRGWRPGGRMRVWMRRWRSGRRLRGGRRRVP